jgi:serine/threonine protein kinase
MRAWTGRVVDGKYRLVRLIGEGGMGVVYEAVHEEILRSVAIKFLWPAFASDPLALKRFHREAQAAGRIGHDNICEVIDVGALGEGVPFIVMPLLKGKSLSDVITECGTVPLARTVDILSQTLDALAAAHAAGIIHRDMKPDNLFLTRVADREDLVKVLDFGVAKVLGDSPGTSGVSPSLTQPGSVVGTPSYMAPEQARGEKAIDHRVDVYALGAVMYEMLTGVRMYDGTTYNEVLHKIFSGDMRAPSEVRPDIPFEMESIIMRAVARLPNRRYPDAATFRKALLKAWALVRESALPPPPPTERAVIASDSIAFGPTTAAAAVVQPVADPPPRPPDPVAIQTAMPPPPAGPRPGDGTPPPQPPASSPRLVVLEPSVLRADTIEAAPASPSVSSRPASMVTAGPSTTVSSVREWKARPGTLVAGIAAGLLVVVTVAYYVAMRASGEQPDEAGRVGAVPPVRGTDRGPVPAVLAAGTGIGPPSAQVASEPGTALHEASVDAQGLAGTARESSLPAETVQPLIASAASPADGRSTSAADARSGRDGGVGPGLGDAVEGDAGATVRLTFPLLPDGATVLIGGTVASIVDQVTTVSKSGTAVEVVVGVPGYREWRGSILADRDRRVPVRLQRSGAASAGIEGSGHTRDATVPDAGAVPASREDGGTIRRRWEEG